MVELRLIVICQVQETDGLHSPLIYRRLHFTTQIPGYYSTHVSTTFPVTFGMKQYAFVNPFRPFAKSLSNPKKREYQSFISASVNETRKLLSTNIQSFIGVCGLIFNDPYGDDNLRIYKQRGFLLFHELSMFSS